MEFNNLTGRSPLLFLLLGFLSGCAETPYPRLAALNPYWRKQWEEDEKYARTYYAKLQEVEDLAASASTLSPPELDQLGRHLAERAQSESNVLLRLACVRALGSVPTEGAGFALKAALQDDDLDVRIAACHALGRRQDGLAVEALASATSSENELDVRLAAARELGQFADNATAVRALGELLEDPNPALQYRAVQSLKSVTRQDFGDNVLAWREFLNRGAPISAEQPSLAERIRNWF